MVASKKPTGDPDCPVWIREAKRANVMIKDRAHSIAFVDEDDEEMASDDERHGVGNTIPLSPGDPGYTKRPSQTQGTLLSGWSATQSQRPDILDDTFNESLAEYAELSQLSAGHMLTSVNPGTNPAAASINPGTNPAAATMRPSPVDTRAANMSHAASAPTSARSTTTGPGTTGGLAGQGAAAARRAKAAQPQAALHTTIASFFNPEARAARDQETGMSQFYAEEVQQARVDLASKTTENQDLRHRIEMMQLMMEMQHTNGFGMHGMMQAPMFVQSNAHQNPSSWEVNTNGPVPRAL
ncbi:hypothetical protein PGT21_011264 [Puccinia graminis f. sp. tritici]|uniref:Uncharacterized protein n=1 Tax=Puccinia graminis f. sp. tritici TaxID=56615 RepID=A0A5B0N2B4_PUCGR|nr:hypothetical protein PGT21_011264 [Puccinia graminis f. sp. tritici]